MPAPSLAELFPDVETVLELEPEELGAVILELWEAHSERNDMTTLDHFINRVYEVRPEPLYPLQKRDDFILVLAEAWSWLERQGFIFRDPFQPAAWYRRTRRGRQLKSPTDVKAFQQASLLPRQLLSPIIDKKAWPAFQRGEYDVAVFQAFKAIEVAVRDACGFPDDLLGPALMRKAFDEDTGLLSDQEVLKAERQAMSHLFAGAIGHAKNPHSHREKVVHIEEAARLLLFASYLLEIVEWRRVLM
ncbi:MAG: TIGR02391 family protein [Proteobacteria bacterium]|nr:TIGR02391 family protein [Pseudomonadota bacterium]